MFQDDTLYKLTYLLTYLLTSEANQIESGHSCRVASIAPSGSPGSSLPYSAQCGPHPPRNGHIVAAQMPKETGRTEHRITASISASHCGPRASWRSRFGTYQKQTFRNSGFTTCHSHAQTHALVTITVESIAQTVQQHCLV